ncbi:hypothetical protein DPMN_187469 [Dreissena polymorpha]|uniref:Receptor ligand binding region domain-containing protein n=1 Tax=Dreissena polymorpha TaxID=45954 RepID=A0A9D4IAD8_DREPO|nr:hypothetical protein DPMN_187469 [Dreissena polymorpha]
MLKNGVILLVLYWSTLAQVRADGKQTLLLGNFTVAAAMKIFEPASGGTCGHRADVRSVQLLEAMKWYLQRINENGGLPFKIGLEAFPTCGGVERTARYGLELMARSSSKSTGNPETIAGVVGPELSTEARILSPILGSVAPEDRLLQLGFSTSAADLGDKKLYPNFARVIPSDNVQIEVMVQTMLSLGWNRIAVIYEDTSYGNDGLVQLQTRSREVGICISLSQRIHLDNGVNSKDLTDALDQSITDNIFGVVFFGTANIANKLIDAMDRSVYTNVPTVLLCEAVNQDFSVFQKLNGEVIVKSEGSVTLSASFHEIPEFKSHWKSVFTNATVFSEEATANPWLRDVYDSITGCTNSPCRFVSLSEQAFSKAFPDPQPVHVRYAILAIHAFAKLVKDLCGASETLCTNITSSFMPGFMIDKIQQTLLIDFRTDFQWSLESLRNKPLITLQKADIFMDTPFSVFNFKKTPNSFEFEKVGDFTNGSLTLNKTLLSPKVQSAVCPVDKHCDECYSMAELHEAVLFEEGEVYVVGVNGIYREGTNGCGGIYSPGTYQIVESIKFAVSKAMQDDAPLSGMRIGLIVLSSCNSPSVIQRKIYSLVHNGVLLHNGSRINVTDRIIGFIGDRSSTVSMAIAEVLSKLRFVQISYASASPELSDRVKYPYFMPTVTPTDPQALAMIHIIKNLKADYIQMVYSTDAFGIGGINKIKELAFENSVCLKQALPVTEVPEVIFPEIVRKLRLYPRAKIVIVFLTTSIIEPFFADLQYQGLKKGEFVFIGPHTWAKNQNIVNMKGEQIIFGAITMALEIAQISTLVEAIKTITPQPFYQNPWATMYLQNNFNCYFGLSFDKTQERQCTTDKPLNVDNLALDIQTTLAYIATKALIQGATAHHKDECGPAVKRLCQSFVQKPEGLVERIKETRFDIEQNGNLMNIFNSNGDAQIGYRIYNIQPEIQNKQNLFYKEVGRFPLEGTLTLEVDKLVFPEGNVTSVCPDERHCATCKPVSGVTTTASPPQEVTGGIIALSVVFGVAVLAVIFLVVAIFCLRKAHTRDKDRIYLNPIETDLRRICYTNEQFNGQNIQQGPSEAGPSHLRPAVIGRSHEETPPRYHDGGDLTQSGPFHEI